VGFTRSLELKKARVTLIRRAVNVWESHESGVMNTVVPETKIPSHHGEDAKTVVEGAQYILNSSKGKPQPLHLHTGMIEFKNAVKLENVVSARSEEPMVSSVRISDGVAGLNSVFELARDLNRSRGDLYEVPVWEDPMKVEENELYLMWATGNESIVISENVDAVRATLELESDGRRGIEKTDKSLGIVKKLY